MLRLMLPIVSAEQMRRLDADTISRVGVPGAVLMESAGRGVVEVLWRLHSDGEIDLHQARIVILAGPGNNGGDGFVIARYLHQRGLCLRLYLCAERSRVRGDALLHLQAAQAAGVSIQDCPSEAEASQLAAHLQQLGSRDLIVDALFGTGLNKTLRGHLAQLVHSANASGARRLAVDLPSGMDADRGLPADAEDDPAPAIVRADDTVTFGFPKLGLMGSPGFPWAGRVYLIDIGIPEPAPHEPALRCRLLDARCLLRLAQKRPPLGHKGSHGHLLIIAGSVGKTGAALLCTRAALRTGVGLCTLAAPAAVVEHALSGQVLEAMSLPYALPAAEDTPAVDNPLIRQWLQAAQGKQAIAAGPGLPQGPQVRQALIALIENGTAPMVLDADALNQVVGEDALLLRARQRGRDLVLTPHPGEAARLLGTTVRQVQADRYGSARRLCQRTGAIVVLKGARTIVVAPAPMAEGPTPPPESLPLSLCPTGNAGMGTGGMGDVLTGILGALLTAGWPAYDAACAAVYWHGLAGDCLAAQRAPGSLLCAGDLIESLDAARSQAVAECLQPAAPTWPLRRL